MFHSVGGVRLNRDSVATGDRYNVPRIAFINKMDRTGANFYKVLDQMRDHTGNTGYAIQLPIGSEKRLQGHC